MSDVTVKGLGVKFGERKVFEGFDITFDEHRINVVLGASGVGKTTLLNAIAGLVPFEGTISGAEGGISYIFQKDRLIPTISVYKNLDLVLRSAVADKNERKERIDEILARLEVLSERDKYPTELSGGQAQRISMARAFLYPSEVLLMDEPFRALDLGLKTRLIAQLDGLLASSPRTVIFVTHDVEECLWAADGYTVLDGAPARIVLSRVSDIPRAERRADDSAIVMARTELIDTLSRV